VEIVDTFTFLLGRWQVTRSIEDHLAGTRGWFAGVATIAEQRCSEPENGSRAHYDEDGQLHFGVHTGAAQRHLEYRGRSDGSVALYFADGRAFVDLDLCAGEWQSTHLCGQDEYTIVTVVRSSGLVEEHWQVHGLAKRYEATTTLTRIG